MNVYDDVYKNVNKVYGDSFCFRKPICLKIYEMWIIVYGDG